LSGLLDAQEQFHHPELEWNTIESEHFYVHYHNGAERTGQTVAKIAEEIYEPVTSLYEHEPNQKVSFVIRDYDDISNGAAYFYDNKIVIYAPSMDFDFRGTHNWLRNVVTHEFTHIVQIQTSMKFGRRLPAFYFQWLGYESERRPDVLYGFPNVVVSTPFSGFVVPAWFAEGVAQYNRKELRYDFWDSHRDMILRSYVLDGNMLTWDEMSVFGKTSLGNESSYNAGFAFVNYIAQKYGEEKLNEISRNLAGFTAVTIDGAIEDAIEKTGSKVYDEWREQISEDYNSRVVAIKTNIRQGEPIMVESDGESRDLDVNVKGIRSSIRSAAEARSGACCWFNTTTGFANLYPAYSPDGKKVAYISTKNADYLSQSSLYVYDFDTKKETLLQPGVRTGVSWSPDGKRIYYGRSTRHNPHWSMLFDIFVYDLGKEEETRLTHGKRAMSPAVSPDGSMIAFVVGGDGTTNLATTKIDGSDFQIITPYVNGEQVYNPTWDPSGNRIIFDYSIKDGRDIATVRPDGSDLDFLIKGPDDSRNGVFSHDGSRIIFSSDRTGVFNLCSYNLENGRIEQVTNVLGGAFMPTLNAEGDVIYSAYTSSGYKIYEMKNPGFMAEGDYHYIQTTGLPDLKRSGPLAMTSNGVVTPQFDWSALRGYDDTKLPEFESKSYRSLFTSLSFVPFVRVDNYNKKNTALEVVKPGVYIFSNEVLDKTGFFAGAALNKQLERDLFLQFDYRGKIPILYQLGLEPTASIELYNVTRKTDNFLPLDPDTIPVDITYNLLEFDFALNHPFISQSGSVEFRYIHSRYTSVLESFVLPAAGRLVPGSSDLYLIGNDLSLTFHLQAIVPSRTSEINPVGRKISFRIGREFNKFNPFGDIEETEGGGLAPVYQNINFTKVELNWKEHIPLMIRNHTLTASLRGASILGPAVDDFFDFYGGGLIGMKGYPYFALGGNELAVLGLAYRFPIFYNIDLRFLNFYFDKLYASVYGDIGNAWTGRVPTLRQFKTDAGIELRLESFSFYSYPTRIFFNAAYGFDKFDRYVESRNATVTYGKEWRFYFGVLFGVDFD
jgi:Tol biopolymer transport system component